MVHSNVRVVGGNKIFKSDFSILKSKITNQMAYLYSNNKVAVELEELVPRFWKSYEALKKELQRYKEKPFGIKRLQIGGNGRRMLIDFDSLNNEIQEALGDPRKAGHPLEPFFKWDTEAPEFYRKFKRAGMALNPEEQERYIVNASVIQSAIRLEQSRIQIRISKRMNNIGTIELLRYDVESFQNHLRVKHNTEHTIPTSLRHFKNVLKEFKANEHIALIKDPNGTGKQNARKVNDIVLEILNGLFAGQLNKPNPTDVSRTYDSFLNGYTEVYNKKTGEVYDPKGFPSLSKATINNYLSNWENSIGTYRARSGNRQKDIARMPHAQMELPKYASSLVSIDDRQPPFWYEKGKRMWFYIGLDVASSCITTFVYGKTKEGLILDFYRQMVRNYSEWGFGLPLELECESSLNSTYKDTLLKEGNMFTNVTIEANNAQRKIIERRFGKLRYNIEKKHSGWIARPFALSESNQAGPKSTVIIPYNELVEARLADLEDWNNLPCENPILKKEGIEMSRWSYFLKNQNPNLKPINFQSILPFIGYKTPSSCHRGFIKLQGKLRAIANNGSICFDEELIDTMKKIEGKNIDIFWLDDNEGEVLKAYAYYNDRFICEIYEFPKFNRAKNEQTSQDKKNIAIQEQYINSVKRFANKQYKSIEPIGIIDNTPKPERLFKIDRVKRYEAKEPKEVVVVMDDEEEYEYAYNYQSGGFKASI